MPPRAVLVELLERTLVKGIRRKSIQELEALADARGVDIPEGMMTHTRQDKVEHFAHKKGVVDRSVKKKLNGVCLNQPLKEFIQRSVAAMTQMAVEATRMCMLRRAIKANRITCHYDSKGEYAEPLRLHTPEGKAGRL
jgi:hypothetical protein